MSGPTASRGPGGPGRSGRPAGPSGPATATSATGPSEAVAAGAGVPQWVLALLTEPDERGLRCLACPLRCVLADGQTGPCQVRRRHGDQIQTATFATTVTHLDPVERKPLYHVRPGSRTLTIAAPGCTFRCTYCVNYRLSQYGRPDGDPWTARPADVADLTDQAAQAGASIALSYTEPGLAIELTLALAEAGRSRGVGVIWKSNGFLTPQAADLVAPALLAANIDIKAADETSHRQLTGAALAPVVDTIRRLRDHGVWVEISTPVIADVNDTASQLAAIADLVASVGPATPWHLLRFTPTHQMTDRAPTTPAKLAEAAAIGRAAGLMFVYSERALGPAGRATNCPACGYTTITRKLWSTVDNKMNGGVCPRCAAPVPGRW